MPVAVHPLYSAVKLAFAEGAAFRRARGRRRLERLPQLAGRRGSLGRVAQAMAGLLPSEPTVSFDCSTGLDPSRAPEGKAVLRLQMLEIPCRPRAEVEEAAVGRR